MTMPLNDIIDKDIAVRLSKSMSTQLELNISAAATASVREDIVMSTYAVLADDFQTPILFRGISAKVNEVLKVKLH